MPRKRIAKSRKTPVKPRTIKPMITTSESKNLEASQIIQPMPAVAATIFATIQVLDAGSADTMRGTLKELEAIAAAVVGGCLLTGGYGSAIGAAFGALIFGTVSMGIFYTDVDTDWFKVFLGAMMLIAVIFNNYIRRKVTESK